MKNLILILSVLVFTTSCKNETKENTITKEQNTKKQFEKIEQLKWLVGNWTNITEEEQSYENWSQPNDSILKAHSFTIVKNDTVFAERVSVKQENDEVYFTVVAYNQNDDKPVTFKMVSSKDKVFTFENPKHDFPTRITYSNPVKDSIHAWIEGNVKNEPRKVDFYFERKN